MLLVIIKQQINNYNTNSFHRPAIQSTSVDRSALVRTLNISRIHPRTYDVTAILISRQKLKRKSRQNMCALGSAVNEMTARGVYDAVYSFVRVSMETLMGLRGGGLNRKCGHLSLSWG